MSLITTVNDTVNSFLERREITCEFVGLGGKLKRPEAVEMITKEFNLEGKLVIPIIMKSQTGRSNITGTFYIYEDEKLAKKHINPVIFARLEKAEKKVEEAAQNEVKEESADDSSKKEDTIEATKDSKEKVDETKAKEPQSDEEKK